MPDPSRFSSGTTASSSGGTVQKDPLPQPFWNWGPAVRARVGRWLVSPSFWNWVLGVGWLLVVAGVGIGLIFYSDGDIVRGLGFLVAGAGVAPLGLKLAYSRTGYHKDQLVDEKINYAVNMLGHKSPSVRHSGIQILRKLARENDGWCSTILRSLASYVRDASSQVRREHRRREHRSEREQNKMKGNTSVPGGTQGKEPTLAERMRELDAELMRQISNDPLARPDTESALVAVKDIIDSKKELFEGMIKEAQERGKYTYTLDFSNSVFIGGRLFDTDLTRCNLSEILSVGYVFERVNFTSANWVGTYLKDCEFEECEFDGAEFDGTTFDKVVFIRVDFSSASLRNVQMKDCRFDECSFKDADLEGIEITVETDDDKSNVEEEFKGAKNLGKIKWIKVGKERE